MAVDRDIGDIGQNPRRAVTAFGEVKECGCLVDELGVVGVVEEIRVFQKVLNEDDIG